jgi:hypothetical protein
MGISFIKEARDTEKYKYASSKKKKDGSTQHKLHYVIQI